VSHRIASAIESFSVLTPRAL